MQLCFYCRDWSQETDLWQKANHSQAHYSTKFLILSLASQAIKISTCNRGYMKKGRIKKTQKWKFKRSDPSCGRAPQYKFIISPHCASQFPLERRLMQSGCYSAPPLKIHYRMSTKPGSGVEASMSCYSSNNLHDTWPGHYIFSLQSMCMACQASGWGVAISSLSGSHLFQPFG